jgi:hypothetical protein
MSECNNQRVSPPVSGRGAPRREGGEMLTIVIVLGGLVLVPALGMLVLLRVGIGGNKRRGFLTTNPQTRADAAARAITGLYVRMPERTAEGQARRVPNEPR